MSGDEVTVSITEFDPDELVMRGRSEDGTGYLIRLEMADAARLIAELTNRGRCPRCDFENSIADVVYAGEYICQHYKPDQPGQLSDGENMIVATCRSWLADEAIQRCLEEPDD